jgi:hypothetical protein
MPAPDEAAIPGRHRLHDAANDVRDERRGEESEGRDSGLAARIEALRPHAGARRESRLSQDPIFVSVARTTRSATS